jgi:hypothetical protein
LFRRPKLTLSCSAKGKERMCPSETVIPTGSNVYVSVRQYNVRNWVVGSQCAEQVLKWSLGGLDAESQL